MSIPLLMDMVYTCTPTRSGSRLSYMGIVLPESSAEDDREFIEAPLEESLIDLLAKGRSVALQMQFLHKRAFDMERQGVRLSNAQFTRVLDSILHSPAQLQPYQRLVIEELLCYTRAADPVKQVSLGMVENLFEKIAYEKYVQRRR